MKTAFIYTLGCKVNQYESEAIAEGLEKSGFLISQKPTGCDVYIINTCTVTAESDRKARQFIRRAIKSNKNAYILVTGCMAQSRSEQAEAIEGVDYICGSSNKMSVVEEALELIKLGKKRSSPKISVPDLSSASFEPMTIEKFSRTRAYIKVEDGCENRCSYCAIPNARGPIRSKPLSEVLCEVRRLTEGGCREIVITGIETASYGRDLGGIGIADLLLEIDKIENVGRIRIGSIDPSVMTEDFVEKIKRVKCLTPHFHLSMQSGSNRILGLMRRKYNREMAWRNIENLKRNMKDVMLTTDFIVGFPTETEEDFEDTLDFARRAEFLDMHVFAYSKRSGTPASEMTGQVSEDIKKRRSATLIALGKELTEKALDRFCAENERAEVLFETYENGRAFGHTASFVFVSAESEAPLHGQLLKVRIRGHENGVCLGEIIRKEEE